MEIPNGSTALAIDSDDLGAARGVIVGVLIAIPIWILMGVVLIVLLRESPAGAILGLHWTFEELRAAILVSCSA